MDDRLRIFPDEFVPNIEGAPYHQKWVRANSNEAALWVQFRDAIIAGQQVTPPAMSTKYGRALVAAGKEHMAVTTLVGAVTPPYPIPTPTPTPPPPSGGRPAAPLLPNVSWSAPITINTGGTYTGNWQSAFGPCITVATPQPIIIENSNLYMTANGNMIDFYNTNPVGADITIRNCLIYGWDSNTSPRWLIGQNWKNLVVENNTIVNTRGIELWPSGNNPLTTRIRYNRHHNVRSDGTLANVGNFVQFRVLGQSSQIELAWNEVLNIPGISWGEDMISIYYTSHVRCHDNMLWHQSVPANVPSSQGGITVDSSDTPGSPFVPNDNIVQDNHIIDGYGVIIYTTNGGSNNYALNNRIVADQFLPDGRVKGAGFGAPLGVLGSPTLNNHAHGNTVGYIDSGQNYIDATALANNMPGAPEGGTAEAANNTILPQASINVAAEEAEWSLWQQKVATNGVTIGKS